VSAEAGAGVFGPEREVINRYVDILANRGIEWGLIGPREGDRLWERHILNSVAGAALFPPGASVLDVGSGAGLPGIPLAILRPDLRLTLLDSLLRRTSFLELAVSELGLGGRVQVVRARAEDHSETYEVVTCRAVAPLPKLIEWCMPRVARGGRLLALKGSSAAEELAEASVELRARGLTGALHELSVPGEDDTTWVVEVGRA